MEHKIRIPRKAKKALCYVAMLNSFLFSQECARNFICEIYFKKGRLGKKDRMIAVNMMRNRYKSQLKAIKHTFVYFIKDNPKYITKARRIKALNTFKQFRKRWKKGK